jgi:hypothetical protein
MYRLRGVAYAPQGRNHLWPDPPRLAAPRRPQHAVASRTYSFRRNDEDYVVFCFAKPEDAEAFCQRFGDERVQPD